MKRIIITIDGHSACGKSTLAKALATELNYGYIDTGAMYRAVTFYFLENRVNIQRTAEMEKALKRINITFKSTVGGNRTYLNGKDVEDVIRKMFVSKNVSHVAAISTVRKMVVKQQVEMGKLKGIVMEGRDIGTVVFPNAELKLFLTADEDIRTKRRYDEMAKKGQKTSMKSIKDNLVERDHIDSTRKDSPLKKAKEAVLIDNSNISPNEQLAMVLALSKERIKRLSANDKKVPTKHTPPATQKRTSQPSTKKQNPPQKNTRKNQPSKKAATKNTAPATQKKTSQTDTKKQNQPQKNTRKNQPSKKAATKNTAPATQKRTSQTDTKKQNQPQKNTRKNQPSKKAATKNTAPATQKKTSQTDTKKQNQPQKNTRKKQPSKKAATKNTTPATQKKTSQTDTKKQNQPQKNTRKNQPSKKAATKNTAPATQKKTSQTDTKKQNPPQKNTRKNQPSKKVATKNTKPTTTKKQTKKSTPKTKKAEQKTVQQKSATESSSQPKKKTARTNRRNKS